MPIALIGKVYCKVDANYSSIEIGDLLTTSDTPGYAMKAADPLKAFKVTIRSHRFHITIPDLCCTGLLCSFHELLNYINIFTWFKINFH